MKKLLLVIFTTLIATSVSAQYLECRVSEPYMTEYIVKANFADNIIKDIEVLRNGIKFMQTTDPIEVVLEDNKHLYYTIDDNSSFVYMRLPQGHREPNSYFSGFLGVTTKVSSDIGYRKPFFMGASCIWR